MGVVRSVGWALSLFRSVLQIECSLVGFFLVKFAYRGSSAGVKTSRFLQCTDGFYCLLSHRFIQIPSNSSKRTGPGLNPRLDTDTHFF